MKELLLLVLMLLYAGMCLLFFPEIKPVDSYHLISEITVVVILSLLLISIKQVQKASEEAYGHFLIGVTALLLATITEAVGIAVELPFWINSILGEFTVIAGFLWFLLGLRSWLKKEAELKAHLYNLSTLDDLTGLMNRRAFLQQASIELHRAKRYKRDLSFIMLDLDHFKSINDDYGHLVGDTVLKEVAETIKGQIRKTEFLARWGGEEFILIMPECPQDKAVLVAERLREKVDSMVFKADDQVIKLTVSMGVTIWLTEEEIISQIVERADKALYEAKNTGRNRVCTRFSIR